MITFLTNHPQDPYLRVPAVHMVACKECRVWWPQDDLEGHLCPDCIAEAQKKADALYDEQWNKIYNP